MSSISEMVPCKLNGKYDIILPKHRADRPEWYTELGWERKRLDSLHDHIKPGEVMFYVGAEEGDMAALCQMWGAKMVLFEPNTRVWANIKAIWKANNLSDPYFFDGFASCKTNTEMIFYGFPESADGPVIPDHGFKELRDPGRIPQITIDDAAFHLGFPPTMISVDVEGSEWDVLHGAEKVLRRDHPRIWLSLHPEFLLTQYNHWGAELRKWIIDLGYKETLLDYPLHEVHLLYEPT